MLINQEDFDVAYSGLSTSPCLNKHFQINHSKVNHLLVNLCFLVGQGLITELLLRGPRYNTNIEYMLVVTCYGVIIIFMINSIWQLDKLNHCWFLCESLPAGNFLILSQKYRPLHFLFYKGMSLHASHNIRQCWLKDKSFAKLSKLLKYQNQPSIPSQGSEPWGKHLMH